MRCSTIPPSQALRERAGLFLEIGTTCESRFIRLGHLRGDGHAANNAETGTSDAPQRGLHQDVYPDVPGYVFWLVMLAIIAFHQLVLHVR